MLEADLLTALDSHLDTMSGRPPVNWANVKLDAAGPLYLTQMILPAEGMVGMAASASEVFRGLYQITINAPKDEGKAAYVAEVDRIRAHFSHASEVVEGSLRVKFTKIMVSTSSTNENFFRVRVSVRYSAVPS